MKMFDDLFAFPIVMIDGDNEQMKMKEKERFGSNEERIEADLVIGEQECPYYDFISVGDRWVPTQGSFDKALNGKFDHCFVVFGNCGSFIVPWPKKKFKEKLRTFIESVPKQAPIIKQIQLTDEQIADLMEGTEIETNENDLRDDS